MSQKNTEAKIHKAQSYDEKPIQSSQHSKIKKGIADHLRGEIHNLIIEKDQAQAQTKKSWELYKFYKAQGNESEAQFRYMSYKTWSDYLKKIDDDIRIKLNAVQKYSSPKKNKRPKIPINKKQQMKYGPSDDEE